MTEGEQNRLLYCETNLKNKEVEKGKNKQASWVSPVRERLWEASLTLLSSSHKRSLLPSLQCNSEPGGVLLWKGQTEEKHKERSSSWFSYILEVRGKLPGSAMRARGRLQSSCKSGKRFGWAWPGSPWQQWTWRPLFWGSLYAHYKILGSYLFVLFFLSAKPE